MLSQRKRSRGFTLPEVLVTVAIIAVLAAVVVPAVTQQLGKGDEPAVRTSIGSLRTAITSFVTDVRRFPGEVDHLQATIANTDFGLSPSGSSSAPFLYTTAAAARWKGPYDNSGAVTGFIPVGLGWVTINTMYDSLGFVVVPVAVSGGANVADATELDVLIDGGNGAATGTVRWQPNAGNLNPVNTVRLFIMSSAR